MTSPSRKSDQHPDALVSARGQAVGIATRRPKWAVLVDITLLISLLALPTPSHAFSL